MEFIKSLKNPVLSGLFGAFLMVLFLRISPDSARRILGTDSIPGEFQNAVDVPVEEDPFDPFQQMEKMQKQMQKQMGGRLNIKTFSNMTNDISEREDENYLYFDIKVTDPQGTEIRTDVSNGYLTIHGETKSKHGDDDSWIQSSVSSSFSRTFPLPDSVDAEKLEMVQEKDKIVIRIPKAKI